MADYKIIFTGPVGAGKTTAISVISDQAPITTDVIASDDTRNIKPTTTVAFDYGTVRLDGSKCIHLYGTPGQQRFDFMWDILSTGGIGLILLIDNTRDNPFQDLRFFLSQFNDFIERTQIAIGVTQMDRKAVPTIEDYYQQTKNLGANFPIFDVDARKKHDVAMLIKALLYSIDPTLTE
jgi:signal recognition particle receptor subunit beta